MSSGVGHVVGLALAVVVDGIDERRQAPLEQIVQRGRAEVDRGPGQLAAGERVAEQAGQARGELLVKSSTSDFVELGVGGIWKCLRGPLSRLGWRSGRVRSGHGVACLAGTVRPLL